MAGAGTAFAATNTSKAASQQNQGHDDQATDLGATSGSTTVTASVILKVHDSRGLQNYIQATTTPGNPQYHKFLSVNQFVARYAPSNGQINQVVHYLQQYGLQVNAVYQDNLDLQVTGTVDQFNQAFDTSIHNYSRDGKRFHAPKRRPRVPEAIVNSVLAVAGLSTETAAESLTMKPAQLSGETQPKIVLPKDGTTATGIPGDFTVGDTANMYDINPLYSKGVTGKGETIGIATLANFVPQDAYTYWNTIGLKYKPNRITQVHVDGGGVLGSAAGSGETTLDVEQSGGLAPDANIIVYDAPNTDAGFLDVFYKAVSDNKVDTLSVSWGEPEIFYVAGMNQGVDDTNELTAFDQAFMEGAAQGISMFAASGDSGAYDTNRSLPGTAGFSTPLSVDAPASDPYITAAGGTTVPTTLTMKHGTVSTGTTEQPWAWDYFTDYLNQYYGPGTATNDPNPVVDLGYFAAGDGGGVSTIWPRPWYQQGVAGMQNTASGQTFSDPQGLLNGTPFSYNLTAGFAGRNVADLSMDADPETGYLLYSSTDGGWGAEGGTSFVAPQLNGITSLMDQDAGTRLGFLNPTLYSLQQNLGYGSDKPFNDLTTGDNWFYQATPGYDPAAGIGTPNVANLAQAIQDESSNHHSR